MTWILDPLDGPIADTLDLHGMTWSEAELAVIAFLTRARKREPGALVHVITGKGKGSPGRPVLKTRMKTMLRAGLPQVEVWGPDLDQGGFLIRLKQR
ncbi:MAG TPA: Smr/MutS family protein [Longimicrobiales bacterium]|nr:Smr/MutS family protein [Longimicrobiales bacterium]